MALDTNVVLDVLVADVGSGRGALTALTDAHREGRSPGAGAGRSRSTASGPTVHRLAGRTASRTAEEYETSAPLSSAGASDMRTAQMGGVAPFGPDQLTVISVCIPMNACGVPSGAGTKQSRP